jgi:capsular polysaccharide transport system permease protein
LDKQIADLNALLLGKTGAGTISNQLKDYEILKLREEFAEQMYMLARSSFEDARKKLDKQQLYLVVVVPPILPELAAYPRVFANTGLVALGSFILWAIAALIFASVRDSQNL